MVVTKTELSCPARCKTGHRSKIKKTHKNDDICIPLRVIAGRGTSILKIGNVSPKSYPIVVDKQP